MPEDEVRQQKGALLLEIYATSQELTNLQEKAKRIALYLQVFGAWLEGLAVMPVDDSPFISETYASALGNVNVFADDGFRMAMDVEQARNLFKNLSDVRHRLANLNDRRRSLGL